MFLSFRKNTGTKCIFVQILKKFKSVAVSLPKMCRSEIFVAQQNFLRALKIHHKILDNSHLKFGKRENAKIKKQFVRWPVLTSVGFRKNVVLQLFPEIQPKLCQFERRKVEQNLTVFKKQRDCFSVFYLNVTCRTL